MGQLMVLDQIASVLATRSGVTINAIKNIAPRRKTAVITVMLAAFAPLASATVIGNTKVVSARKNAQRRA
jgi:hypothetical protein